MYAEHRNQLHPAEEMIKHNYHWTLDLVWSWPGARVKATMSPRVSQKEITGPKVLMCSCLDSVDIPRYIYTPDVLVVLAQLSAGPHAEAGEAAAVQQVQPLVPRHGHQPPVRPQRHLPHRPVTQAGLLGCNTQIFSVMCKYLNTFNIGSLYSLCVGSKTSCFCSVPSAWSRMIFTIIDITDIV